MGRRYELSEVGWEALSRYLPSAVTGGRPRVDDRRVLNGIVWKIRAGPGRAGAAWRDVPARYGSWQSIYTRFRRWALDGTFERMLAGVQADADALPDRRAVSASARHPRANGPGSPGWEERWSERLET
ncbi:transposase [Micromonospora sp. NPDC049282]|uniref:transposase n=1 Tax=Micromonospora sp. NPDC049282 TaxID=3364269 RepID=UPI00371C9C42